MKSITSTGHEGIRGKLVQESLSILVIGDGEGRTLSAQRRSQGPSTCGPKLSELYMCGAGGSSAYRCRCCIQPARHIVLCLSLPSRSRQRGSMTRSMKRITVKACRRARAPGPKASFFAECPRPKERRYEG